MGCQSIKTLKGRETKLHNDPPVVDTSELSHCLSNLSNSTPTHSTYPFLDASEIRPCDVNIVNYFK